MAAKKQTKTVLTEQKKSNKFFSRKFLVWFTATVIMVFTLVINFKHKDSTLASEFMSWWGGISLCYIGGNVAQDFIEKKGTKSE